MIGSIAAPCDLFLDGNGLHGGVRRELIPGVQHAIAVSAFHDTSPSITETRVPLAPRLTENKVPLRPRANRRWRCTGGPCGAWRPVR